jgi:hypothetical protein
MTKENFPVRLLIQGEVGAYSKEQIRDAVESGMKVAGDIIFDSEYPNLAYQLVVGNEEFLFTGSTREEIINSLARNIYENRQGFCKNILEHLEVLEDTLDTSSGIIFKHKASQHATKSVKLLREYLQNYVLPYEKIPEDQKIRFRGEAEDIASRTIWWYAKTILIKEG